MREVLLDLQNLGLTEYEAKTYIAVLQHPDSTGYEVAKNSGVPRAKIYETLDNLQRKGLVIAGTIDTKQVHRALPYTEFLSRCHREMGDTLARLTGELARLQEAPEQQGLFTLRGHEHILLRAKEMCQAARTRLFITGFPEEIKQIEPDILAAEKRGVKAYVLSYGQADYQFANAYFHSVTGAQYLQVAAFGRWLGLIADQEQGLLAQMIGAARSLALWTANEVVTFAVTNWITHDIMLNVLLDTAPPPVLLLAIKETAHLQTMNILEPEEATPLVVDETWPQVDEILSRAVQRLELSRTPADYGLYEFMLRGDDADTCYRISVAADRVELNQADDGDNPDLKVTLSSADLRAIAAGKLSPAAFTTRGRIRVEGDLALAANLQRLLR